jgi:hypothetical protein
MATGTNLQLDGDLARRSVFIRQDSKVERPWERSGFKHDPFIPWVESSRHELAWALLTLCRHWIVEGRPLWQGTPQGSFEDFCRVVGGILELAGFDDFLRNRAASHDRADWEASEWRAFTTAWWGRFQDQPVGVADLFPLVMTGGLLPSLMESERRARSERSLKTALGTALKSRQDQRFGELFLRTAGDDTHRKTALYRLVQSEVA